MGEDGKLLGVVTEGNLTAKLMSGRVKATDSVTEALYRQYAKVELTTSLKDLARLFDMDHFALVVTGQKSYGGSGQVTENMMVTGVVSRIDLLRFISGGDAPSAK